jgi:hypothetical protein
MILVGGVHDGVKKIAIDHRSLHEEVKPGDRILIDDGLFELIVERIEGSRDFHSGGQWRPAQAAQGRQSAQHQAEDFGDHR